MTKAMKAMVTDILIQFCDENGMKCNLHSLFLIEYLLIKENGGAL